MYTMYTSNVPSPKSKEVQVICDTCDFRLLFFFVFQWTYIMAGIVAFLAFIMAYALDLIELHPGGRARGLWS